MEISNHTGTSSIAEHNLAKGTSNRIKIQGCSEIHCLCVQLLRRVQLFATLWTVACQTPLSMGFSR